MKGREQNVLDAFERAEFKRRLIRPLLAYIGFATLLAAASIGGIFWRRTHGHPAWAQSIALCNICVNMALMVGWSAFVLNRRRKELHKLQSSRQL